MNELQTEWWSVGIPPEFWADREEDVFLIADNDGVGCIEITTLQREEGEFSGAEVRQIAIDNAEGDWDWREASCGDFSGWYSAWLDAEAAVREWYLARGDLMLFVTYSCEPEQAGLDDAAVDEILNTLRRL